MGQSQIDSFKDDDGPKDGMEDQVRHPGWLRILDSGI